MAHQMASDNPRYWTVQFTADVLFSVTVVLVGTALIVGRHSRREISVSQQQRENRQLSRKTAIGGACSILTLLVHAATQFVFQDLPSAEQGSADLDNDELSMEEQWEARDQLKARPAPSQMRIGNDDSLPKPAIIIARNALRKAIVNTSNQFQQHRPHLLSKSRALARHLRHRRHNAESFVPEPIVSKTVQFDMKHTAVYHYDDSTSSSGYIRIDDIPELAPSDSIEKPDCDSSISSSEDSSDFRSSTSSILKKQFRYSQRINKGRFEASSQR